MVDTELIYRNFFGRNEMKARRSRKEVLCVEDSLKVVTLMYTGQSSRVKLIERVVSVLQAETSNVETSNSRKKKILRKTGGG